jgi:hypothetical protein
LPGLDGLIRNECWGRKSARAPDVVALIGDAAKNGLTIDRGRHRIRYTELKLLPQQPPLRAAAPGDILAGFVGRYREELLIAALEEVSGLCIVQHL